MSSRVRLKPKSITSTLFILLVTFKLFTLSSVYQVNFEKGYKVCELVQSVDAYLFSFGVRVT